MPNKKNGTVLSNSTGNPKKDTNMQSLTHAKALTSGSDLRGQWKSREKKEAGAQDETEEQLMERDFLSCATILTLSNSQSQKIFICNDLKNGHTASRLLGSIFRESLLCRWFWHSLHTRGVIQNRKKAQYSTHTHCSVQGHT